MGFTLEDVVPWGRGYDEYVAMFALAPEDLSGRMLGCGDGPACFNAVAHRRGHAVVSVDPLYRFTPAQIRSRIDATAVTVAEQTRRNAGQFVWSHFRSVDALIASRMQAMDDFLDHYAAGARAGRYVSGALPRLPFAAGAFDLALCSHLLFLYGDRLGRDLHVRALFELVRVAREVRVFPLLDLDGTPSDHLEPVMHALRTAGFAPEAVPVAYEFQRGGDRMLRVRRAV